MTSTPAGRAGRAGVDALIEDHSIVVCCGSGGVGKTTISAVLALEAARRGRDAVVVTIDPAKRLADTLGLASLSDVPTEIHRAAWADEHTAPGGRLFALMLDTKSTFDRLVTANALSPEQAERILSNTFYRNISGALSGTQEYMAAEKLYELHAAGRYDLIVVDTPPTRHALDFLDAPERLLRLLDNRIFRLLMLPTRVSVRMMSAAMRAFLHTVARVVGSEVIDDVVAFFHTFEGMEEGFRRRAHAVEELLAARETAFALVTSPRRDSVVEAEFFADRLAESGRRIDTLIVNRVHPAFGDESPGGLRARATELADLAASGTPAEPPALAAARRLAALYENLADFREVADAERRRLRGLGERIGTERVCYVPYLVRDVYDFEALGTIGRLLFGDERRRAEAGSPEDGPVGSATP